MSNKNGLSFMTRLWLFVLVLIILVCLAGVAGVVSNAIGFIALSLNSNGIAMVVAVSIFTAGFVISTAIISLTILKVFGRNKDDKKK